MVEVSNQDFEEMLDAKAKYALLKKACLEGFTFNTYDKDLQFTSKGEHLVATLLKFIEPEEFGEAYDRIMEERAAEIAAREAKKKEKENE